MLGSVRCSLGDDTSERMNAPQEDRMSMRRGRRLSRMARMLSSVGFLSIRVKASVASLKRSVIALGVMLDGCDCLKIID